MIAGQADILIQIERHYTREIEFSPLVHADELLVQPKRRRPRGHPEHGVGLCVEQLGDRLRRQFAHLVVILPDDYFHELLTLCSHLFLKIAG